MEARALQRAVIPFEGAARTEHLLVHRSLDRQQNPQVTIDVSD
jgi:hypothetical protein